MKLSRALLIIIFFIFHFHSFSQLNIPKGYFLFPIKPGKPNYLAGNMGELRATHFHAGIDIKTDGREGLPVYAAADGYVSRIKISTSGYGNALYLTHPNGFTTVYAHLLSFHKILDAYLLEHQYQNESFEIEIVPAKDQFTFAKGDILGLSGNSGGSGGPHLHFEIRDSLEYFYDPLLFGFTEIADHQPAVVEKLAIKTFGLGSRVNGEFGRFEFQPQLNGNEYVISAPIFAKGIIGLELLGHDKADYTSNKYGISNLSLAVDGIEVFGHTIDKMHFNDARKILIHTDFEVAQKTGKRFEKLYVDNGNNMSIYVGPNNGKLLINDTLTHQIELRMWDAFNNERKLKFQIKGSKEGIFNLPGKETLTAPSYSIQENILKVVCNSPVNESSSLARVYIGHRSYELAPSYKVGSENIFLWDLREGLPDSVSLCKQNLLFAFAGIVPSGKEYNVSSRMADLRFKESTLFDTLFLDMRKIEQTYKIQNPYIPLQDYIFITLKPDHPVDKKEKTRVYSISPGNSYSFEGGSWNQDGSITFKTKYFSYFTLNTDTIPPTVKFAIKNSEGVKFTITDNLSGIGKFRATINGNWLLMNYDHKKKLIWSVQKDKTIPLKGNFELVVTDNAGNDTVFKTTL